jgi:ketosteroid isomerase-like protein
MKKIALLFYTFTILLGCTSTPKVDTVAEAKTIRNIEEKAAVYFQNKDIENMLSGFSSDAIFMQPNVANVVGQQSLRKTMESMFADTTILWKTFSANIETVEVSASGDLGYARGTNKLSIKTPNGVIESSGKWLDIFKKIDGKWKCVFDMMMP